MKNFPRCVQGQSEVLPDESDVFLRLPRASWEKWQNNFAQSIEFSSIVLKVRSVSSATNRPFYYKSKPSKSYLGMGAGSWVLGAAFSKFFTDARFCSLGDAAVLRSCWIPLRIVLAPPLLRYRSPSCSATAPLRCRSRSSATMSLGP